MNDNIYNSGFADQFHAGRAQEWLIKRLISGINTAKIVTVLAVQPTAGKVGFVTVQPLVLGLTTNGTIIEESPIYQVPYSRLQGGASAVILDPAVGDIGIALFAQDDISNLKVAPVEGPPASDRTYAEADALYIGQCLNGDPTQFVEFRPGGAGITIHTPGDLNLQATGAMNLSAGGTMTIAAASLVINAPVTFNNTVTGTPTTAGAVTFGAPVTAPDFVAPNAKLNTHQHNVSGSTTVGNPHN